ncbi:hypothetical protein MCUN1_001352 [Malassezia cuniculi]|uniref:PhoD-like phosphatase domain-containing protein n=1 Tax=Malassezia cuniculi TaxID=948313 RepID=A0AAF0EUC6_9BASI|nr:hypothetical protein MCUN1_001352 [Malassezia cuniculi]
MYPLTLGPLLRYDTVEEGTYHAFAMIVTEHAMDTARESLSAPNLVYASNGDASTALQSQAKLLYVYDDVDRSKRHVFWRFKIEVALNDGPQTITYAVDGITQPCDFVVPSKTQNFRWAGHSCNGFSSGVNTEEWGGPDPLWRDVLAEHERDPFHLVMGGGDQIYNDTITSIPELKEWNEEEDRVKAMQMPLTDEIKAGIDRYLFRHYAEWFGSGAFSKAISRIPMVNMLDDHDLIDGFGTYPDRLMNSPIFNGIGKQGFFFYLLFQQFVVDEEDDISNSPARAGANTPFRSFIIGGPGAYIPFPTHSILTYLGPQQYMLLLDCRAQRRLDEICAKDTYDRCREAILRLPDGVKHLIIQLGVPLAYPRMVLIEKLLSSKFNPIVFLAKKLLPKFTNNFNGQVELLDDLNDHWCAIGHKRERNRLIESLHDIAVRKRIRISFISGDVHAGGCSIFEDIRHTKPEEDHKYMVAMITSAIVNVPPPAPVITMINALARKKHKTLHHLFTREYMLPLFEKDFSGKPQKNKYIVGARNWCATEYDTKTNELVMQLRVEKEQGTGKVATFEVRAPPPNFRKH